MSLAPEASIGIGLASATLAYGIFNAALPSAADVRSLPPGQQDVQAAERMAGWTSAAVVAGVSLMARDMTVFIIGGGAVIALTWWYRHSDMVTPILGQAVPGFGGETQQVSPEGMAQGEMYDYTQSDPGF